MKMFLLIILLVFMKILINKLNNKHNVRSNRNIAYSKKQLMTKYERYFYDVLIELKDELNIEVMPQVNLGTNVNKKSNNRWQNELLSLDKNITVAVMGCVVNGPGEGKHADIGIAGAGSKAIIFKKGEIVRTIDTKDADKIFREELNSL